MSAPAWEQSKENAAPLERGRNVASFGLRQTRLSQNQLKQKVQEYEDLVRPSEAPHVTEMDGDPLVHWLGYIKFNQNSFPADTRDNFLLMERCVRALVKMKQYANDDRFIGVCAKYADKTKDPGQVFKYLHQQKIGTYTALFWIAWAFVAEKDNDFPFAEQIFKKGISKNAQPLQMLKLRHQQFQRRMSRHWLNSSRASEQLDEYEEYDGQESNRSRSALGGLTRDRVRVNDRSRSGRQRSGRPGGLVSARKENISNQQQLQANRNGSFPIFVEPEGENGYNLDQSYDDDKRVIPRDADRKKENTLEAERWNERGGLQPSLQRTARSRSTGPPAPFSVFVDEECAVANERQEEEEKRHLEHQRQVRDDRTFREREGVGVAERLVRDPLRYMRDPSQLEFESGLGSNPKPVETGSSNSGYTDGKSRSERKSRTGFNKRLLKNKNGEEQCFEEARAVAGCYKLLLGSSSNFNFLEVKGIADQSSQMDCEDGDASMDISMAESTSRHGQKSTSSKQPCKLQRVGSKNEGKRLFHPDASFEVGLNQTAISNTSSTVNEIDAVGMPARKDEETINTKLAMRELSMMFSSPAFGIDGQRRQNSDSLARSRINESLDRDMEDNCLGNLGDGLMLDNSICNSGSNENHGERNPSPRTNETDGFEKMALRELTDAVEEGSNNPLRCSAQVSRRVGEVSQSDPLRGSESDLNQDPGFSIYEDDPGSAGEKSVRPSNLGFQIFEDDDRRCSNDSGSDAGEIEGLKESYYETGDTISLSEANEIFGERENQGEDTSTLELSLINEVFGVPAPKKGGGGFDIHVDDEEENNHDECTVNATVVHTNDDNSSYVTNRESRVSVKKTLPAFEYQKVHNHDVQMALRRLQTSSMVAADSRTPLFSLLVPKSKAYYFPACVLPKQLRKSRLTINTEIAVGKHSGILTKVLGNGAYGRIFLMNGTNGKIAIKVQSPTDCLAWEYEILQRLEKRILSRSRCYTFWFPRPFAFLQVADGAILSMSAVSDSGLNLVDLSNFYKLKLGQTVPEIIALHYTSVALRIVEELHWHGKILHCDVKPDNFVLCSTNSSQDDFGSIEYSGLALVDFGRSIDLTQFSPGDEDAVRNIKFVGNAMPKEMQCLAMRSSKAWSYDADTFGILCSAHVLLYGTHMEIRKGKDTKWRTTTSLKRYWQQDIWNELFETLLNLDGLGMAIGSRSGSLRAIRQKIDIYLRTDSVQEKLRSLLMRQANILPDSRDKIS